LGEPKRTEFSDVRSKGILLPEMQVASPLVMAEMTLEAKLEIGVDFPMASPFPKDCRRFPISMGVKTTVNPESLGVMDLHHLHPRKRVGFDPAPPSGWLKHVETL